MQNLTMPAVGSPSPWGAIDHIEALGPEVVVVSTPSHGGFWVSPRAMSTIPEPLRVTPYSSGGWFEEDCDWCIPYLALGLHRFEPNPTRAAENLAAARSVLRACHGAFADQLACGAGGSAG